MPGKNPPETSGSLVRGSWSGVCALLVLSRLGVSGSRPVHLPSTQNPASIPNRNSLHCVAFFGVESSPEGSMYPIEIYLCLKVPPIQGL